MTPFGLSLFEAETFFALWVLWEKKSWFGWWSVDASQLRLVLFSLIGL